MIICINVERNTKDQMDQLIKAGEYRDYSELAAIAIGNQLLLHGTGENGMPHSELISLNGSPRIEVVRPLGDSKTDVHVEVATPPRRPEVLGIPEIFQLAGGSNGPSTFAPLPNDAFAVGMEVSVDRWIFGQHNKLLPAKANVRALANLLRSESSQGGLSLERASTEIAAAAVGLGDLLRHLDASSQRSRDDSFGVAFPSSDPANSDKSRLRYGSQFVGAISKEGRMTGLLIDLKLINHDRYKSPRIQLTEQGWRLAELPNPILDGPQREASDRFSPDESELLIAHIASSVPAEHFAYKATLSAITDGYDTPESLDAALKKYLPDRKDKPFTDAFLTTQRAGVISRMADLGLVARTRTGPNVTYVATARGKQFTERGR
jgi:hypothetical protein